LGYGHAYISRVETGKLSPSWRFLTGLANLLNVPLVELFYEAGLIERAPVDEGSIVAMIAAYPNITVAFEYARRTGNRDLLAHLERQAELLIMELEAQGEDIGVESRGGTPAEAEGPGD